MVVLMAPLLLTGCGKSTDLEEIKNKYSTENIDELDLSERAILEMLKGYEEAYNSFQSNKDNVESRKNLVSKTKDLNNIANKLIENKINVAMGTDYEITIEYNDADHKYELFGDDQKLDLKLPNPLNEIINNKDFIASNVYGGDGSSSAWDKEIDEFNKKGMELYTSLLKYFSTDYELDGNKLEITEEEANKIVR